MSPRKLTETDKQEILKLYRETEETTSTLASRYDVSSSTISRFLKNNLSESEYEFLIQQKRLGRTAHRTPAPAPTPEVPDAPSPPAPKLILRESRQVPPPVSKTILEAQEMLEEEELEEEAEEESERSELSTLEEMFGEDLSDLDDEDEDDEDEDDDWQEEVAPPVHAVRGVNIRVLPLSEASLPKACYLVIDRASELITRPLKEFGDLGKIPAEEVQQRTLPVFEHHKVARRFSNRSQRVIKVPDSRILKKTGSYLQAKGITRLLIDGQVYEVSAP